MNRRKFLKGMLAAQVGVGVIVASSDALPTQKALAMPPIKPETKKLWAKDTTKADASIWPTNYEHGRRIQHRELLSQWYASKLDQAIYMGLMK